MTGIILAFVAIVWIATAFWLSKKLGSRANWKQGRWLVITLAFAMLAPLPLADEILGAWQFQRLCAEGAELKTDAIRIKGRTVRIVIDPRSASVPNTAIPIHFSRYSYRDISTGEELATYTEFDARGGRLVHLLPILDRKVPLLIGLPWCGPPDRSAFPQKLGFRLA